MWQCFFVHSATDCLISSREYAQHRAWPRGRTGEDSRNRLLETRPDICPSGIDLCVEPPVVGSHTGNTGVLSERFFEIATRIDQESTRTGPRGITYL